MLDLFSWLCKDWTKKIIATAGREDSPSSTSTFLKKETFENDSHMDGLDVHCIMQHLLILFPNNLTDQQDAENVSDSENVSSCSSDSEEREEAKDDDGEDVAVVQLSWKPSGGPVSLGEWEQHTKVSCLR